MIVSPSVLVTILANDDAAGVFVIYEPFPSHITEDGGETATFTVQRESGRYGSVRVPWQVANSSACGAQLTPTEGSVLFNAEQGFASFTLSAVDDNVPEVEQTCSLELLTPISLDDDNGEGRVHEDKHSTSTIISANDDYAGVFGFSAALRNVTGARDRWLRGACVWSFFFFFTFT